MHVLVMRILAITPIPTPYRDPFWEHLSRRPDVDLTVVYCVRAREDRPWRWHSEYSFRRLFPAGRNLTTRFGWGAACYWNWGIQPIFEESKPDVVLIGGYNHLTMLQAVGICKQRRVPWLLMTESHKHRPGIAGLVKDHALKHWLRSCAGGLPTGILASRRLESLGIVPDRQIRVPNVPNLELLEAQSRRLQANEMCVRERLQIARDETIVLFAGRMIPKKRPLLLIEAWAQSDISDRCRLVMAGDGPLRGPAERLVEQLSLASRVTFTGFLQSPDLLEWLSVANLFVMPSTETWGVAPIEALACGVPVLLADGVGCHVDVLSTPLVGEVLPAGGRQALAGAISRWLQNLPGHDEVRRAWRPVFDEYKYCNLADRLLKGLRHVFS